jgi:hypothetical protein
MAKNLTNKLYVKKKLYGLQMEENTNLLEHLNKFNIRNTHLLNFEVKIEEDKAILLLTSLPHSYDHLVMILLYGKETLELEEVTEALLSHEMTRKHIIDQADGIVARFETKHGRDKSERNNGRGMQCWLKLRSAKGEESLLDAKRCGVILLSQRRAI